VTQKVTEWKQTGYSDRLIDGERLARDISDAVGARSLLFHNQRVMA
jgi:hypothetical protein